jgi:hypothetical protein
MKKFLALSLISYLFINIQGGFAQTNSQINAGSNSSDFTEKIYFAILGAVLAFTANLLLDAIKKRREIKKQITYNLVIKKGIVEVADVEKSIKTDIKILYQNHSANNLNYILFNLENTGNKDIKNQYLRLEFSNNSEIRNFFYDPIPEPEIGLIKENNMSRYEAAYRINYLKPGTKLGFRFIVEGTDDKEVTLKAHHVNNESDQVDFLSGQVKRMTGDRDILAKFISLLLVFLLVPLAFESISVLSPLLLPIPGIIRFLVLSILIPIIPSLSKLIASLVLDKEALHRLLVGANGDRSVGVGGSAEGSIFITGNGNMVGNRNLKTLKTVLEGKLLLNDQTIFLKQALEDIHVEIDTDLNLQNVQKIEAHALLKEIENSIELVNHNLTKDLIKFLERINSLITLESPKLKALIQSIIDEINLK